MTNRDLLRVMSVALLPFAGCGNDFSAGSYNDGGSKDAPAQETAIFQDSGSPASSIPGSCDPFNPTANPITLGTVLGAGRDTDGTLYVVDQPQPGSERVLVSSGATLQRQRIAGSGTESSGNGVMSYTYSISDHVPPFTLKLETNAAGPTAMGVLQGTTDVRTFTIGQQGSVLTLVPASQVAGLPVADIPAETFIEYNATLSDGRALLVVRPRDDWTYQDFRVFFGTADHMVERSVDKVMRLLDGGSTTINFTIDGVAAVASFPVSLTGVAAPPTLTLAGTQFPLTLGPTDSPPAGYAYLCLGTPSIESPDAAADGPVDRTASDLAPSSDRPLTFFEACSGLPVRSLSDEQSCVNATCVSHCDPGPAPVATVTIAPGGPLLAEVKVTSGSCVGGYCSASAPSCSQTTISNLGNGMGLPASIGATCDLVAIATDGRSQSFRITVVQSRPAVSECCGYPSPPYFGLWTTSTPVSFDRPEVVVDFNRDGGVGDAGNPDGYNDASAALRGVFAPTGSMNDPRYQHTATLLPNGKVLIAGGVIHGPDGEMMIVYDTPAAELYDPATETFAATGGMNAARYGHTATLLPSGQVLITGGQDNENGLVPRALASAELYDPGAGTFAVTGSMIEAMNGHTATLLDNGKVLVAGGTSAELYDPVAGTFTAAGTIPVAAQTATLLLSGRVLITGADAIAVLYDPAAGIFTATGNMTAWRYRHAATLLPSGKVLIAGGQSPGYESSFVSAELYDPNLGTFTLTGNMSQGRSGPTATSLPSGKVLIAGGDSHLSWTSAELYDPVAGTFAPTGNMAAARAEYTATPLLPSGKVLIAGGQGPGTLYSSAELYE